jgi:hypothetical protein
MNDWEELIETFERNGYAIYQGLGDYRDEFILTEAKASGRTVLNGCSLSDIQRFAQQEFAARR